MGQESQWIYRPVKVYFHYTEVRKPREVLQKSISRKGSEELVTLSIVSLRAG